MNSKSQETRSQCKVDHLAEDYDLRHLDDRITEEHQEEEASLRDLETFVNQEVLKTTLKEADISLVDGDVENYYRLITADPEDPDCDVSPDAKQEAVQQLEQAGIDVESLDEDFVSYQTIRAHLNECLSIETGRKSEVSIEKAKGTFTRLRERATTVVEKTLEQLRRHDEIQMGEPNISINIQVECTDCHRQRSLEHILKHRGCRCMNEDTNTTPITIDEDPDEELTDTGLDEGILSGESLEKGSNDDVDDGQS